MALTGPLYTWYEFEWRFSLGTNAYQVTIKFSLMLLTRFRVTTVPEETFRGAVLPEHIYKCSSRATPALYSKLAPTPTGNHVTCKSISDSLRVLNKDYYHGLGNNVKISVGDRLWNRWRSILRKDYQKNIDLDLVGDLWRKGRSRLSIINDLF